MQLTLKVILNSRLDEQTFYNYILSSPHDILTRGVEDDATIEIQVDKEDLEKAKVTTSFVEKEGLFHTKPLVNEVPEASILQSKWDQLVADGAEVKANQVENNKKLDLVLELDKKVNMILQILTKNEQQEE